VRMDKFQDYIKTLKANAKITKVGAGKWPTYRFSDK
jgi:hypothetical protein